MQAARCHPANRSTVRPIEKGTTTMGETPNNPERMPQQANDAQRQQAGQQNQQGETRQPQQQQDDRQQTQPGQQNQQADRERRGDQGADRAGEDDLTNGSTGGVDTGAIEPGRTDDGGAER
ncbi:hypothetical protein J2X45_003091 [Caulobacter sp. BE264]|uniref:hypothetical protein n=1 Tax=Caulobacter sp. BE264 TaxID=2817724 RepID=UPI00285A70DC|nr:hypothetical protein [Caulobacter sp. BE264]MDR7231988.1 hypothetical protein [Caulobacter sp. BE264]